MELVAAEAGRLADLLAGDLPHALVEHAEEAGVELLPYGGELRPRARATPGSTPARTRWPSAYQLAWLADADPFVLLSLRGLPRDDLLARLHDRDAQRAADIPDDVALALDAAARASRILELARQGRDDIDHLL